MDKKQFYHQMNARIERFTAVVEVPTKEEMAQIISLSLFHKTIVNIKYGLSMVNPKDKHYIKELGRTISSSRIEEFKFELAHAYRVGNTMRIQFVSADVNNPICRLNFESNINRNKIYLTEVSL